jgi:putative inorganic carbon (HCO3(-)) transporter
MSAAAVPVEPRAAAGLVAAAAVGLALAMAGVAAAAPLAALGGGALIGAALVPLIATGWAAGLPLVVLALPLPALYADGGVRIATVAPVTAIVVFGLLMRRAADARPFDRGAMPVAAAVVVLAAFAVATLLARHPADSAREMLNIALHAGLLVVATDALAGRPAQVRRVIRLLVAAGAVCGVLGVLESIGVLYGAFPRHGTPFNRAALGFGQPNALGLFLAVVLPLAVHEVRTSNSPRGRAGAWFALTAIALGLAGTFSRGSWLAVLAATPLLVAAGDASQAWRAWLAAVGAAIAIDAASGGALRDTVVRTLDDWIVEQRAALQLAGVLMFLERPLTGVGPGGFAPELDRIGARIPWLWDYLPTPHNAYIQMAAETGIVGLTAFIVLFGTTVARQLRHARRLGRTGAGGEEHRLALTLLWSLGAACAAGMVVWPFSHGTAQAVLLVVAASWATAGARAPAPQATS